MFFRIIFLYVSKIAAGAFWLALIAWVLRWRIASALVWIVFPLGVGSAILAVWLLMFPRLRCPVCGTVGRFVTLGKRQPGVECPRCGVIFAEDILFSFQLCQEDVTDD
jgi:hypothetical protein